MPVDATDRCRASRAIAGACQRAPAVQLSAAVHPAASEGKPSGINRDYRLCRGEGLAVRKRKGRRKALGTRAPIIFEAKPNARCSLDFVHEQFANGRRFRIGAWVTDYNNARPHSSLHYRTPAAFAADIATGLRALLLEGYALPPVAQPAPHGVTTAEALIATG
jgi:transposase InsO family protein